MEGWETGRFAEGLASVTKSAPIDTWGDLASALGVSVPGAMGFLREWRPKAAAALDAVDVQLTALDEAADAAGAQADIETVVVSFGGPTRRQRAEGFWEAPKSIPGYDNGELRLIDPEKGWVKENIIVAGIAGTVVAATHVSGHGGGYVSVTVAVVPGTSDVYPNPSTSTYSAFEKSAARAFYVLWWANREEERGHRLGAVELMDVAPPTPQAALAFGRKFIRAVEKVNGKTIDELYEIAANADGKHYKEPSWSDFGHYLAMQAEGTSVSWWDDHPKAPIKVPSANYYGSGQGEVSARFISNTSRRR